MASQQPNNPGQNQLGRDNMLNQPSDDIHSQGQAQAQNPNFLQETGSHIGNMAHGATEIGKGAFMGAATLASGAAHGTSNVAQGAADAIKNTFGLSGSESAAINHPNSNANANMDGSGYPINHPNSNANANMDGSGYPNRPSYPHAP